MTEACLFEAYRRTSFFADTPPARLRLRIGEVHAELDAWLLREGVRTWAYVTAYNPGSIALDEDENIRRQTALEGVLGSAGLRFFPGEGVGDDGRWPPERSVLVLGVTREQALELGRRFGQRAVVYGESGGPAELLACEESGQAPGDGPRRPVARELPGAEE